jgi:2-isopropylmalate synthase/UPF0716 protein FxsA
MIYFLIYLFLEVIVSVNISSQIGGLATFFEIILSAFYGIYILTNFRNTLMENLMSVSYKQIDMAEFERLNLFTIIGGILLIIPGFLTDILGFLLQFSAFTSMLVNRFGIIKKQQDTQNFYETQGDDDVIDVEIIEKLDTNK